MTEQSKELVNWEGKMAVEAANVAAHERPQVGNIKVQGGLLMYRDQPLPNSEVVCVILGSAVEHRYYSSGYDPNNIQAPNCFALDLTGELMAPHENSADPQASECSECPMFKWGSSPRGGRGKACSEVRRLVVLPADRMDANEIAKAELAMLKVSVTNVKRWSNYVNKLASAYKRPPWAIVTKVSTRPDAKNQYVMNFMEETVVKGNNLLAALNARSEEAKPLLLSPYEAQAEEEATTEKNAKY